MNSAYGCELSLVCPAFNESENIPELLAEWDGVLRATGRTYEMVLVDDESTDATPQRLQEAMRRYKCLRVLRMRKRSGQSAALAAGFAAARGQWIITSDGDLQNDPNDLPKLLELAIDFDMVCGWRTNRRDTWTKRFISRFANARRRRLLDDGVHDTGCGLKVMRRAVATRVLQFDGMHRFFPALAKIEGFTVTEVAVHHRPRSRGKSKYWIFNRFRKPIQDLQGVAWYRARRLQFTADELTPNVTKPSPISRAG